MKKIGLVFVIVLLIGVSSLVAFADVVPTVDGGCKISGYIKPEVVNTSKLNKEVCQGFTVEAVGTGLKGVTNKDGYFEIAGLEKKSDGYKLILSKLGYLKRTIDITAVQGDLAVNIQELPILIWPGDISKDNIQDDSINMLDVMCMAIAFNSALGDEGYRKEYDFNIDGSVNMMDILCVAMHFNSTMNDYPACVLPKVIPEPTPVLTKFVGKLVWNTFEGGFYGVVGEDKDGNTVKYDIGQGMPGIQECLNGIDSIEITGCPQPDMPSTHQWGTPFELMWYKLIESNGALETSRVIK